MLILIWSVVNTLLTGSITYSAYRAHEAEKRAKASEEEASAWARHSQECAISTYDHESSVQLCKTECIEIARQLRVYKGNLNTAVKGTVCELIDEPQDAPREEFFKLGNHGNR
jgi:hypothetical protein